MRRLRGGYRCFGERFIMGRGTRKLRRTTRKAQQERRQQQQQAVRVQAQMAEKCLVTAQALPQQLQTPSRTLHPLPTTTIPSPPSPTPLPATSFPTTARLPIH